MSLVSVSRRKHHHTILILILLLFCSAKALTPSWVAFGRSRGFEGYIFKLFMRYSGSVDFLKHCTVFKNYICLAFILIFHFLFSIVVIVDLLIFYPAVIFYFYKSYYQERIKVIMER